MTLAPQLARLSAFALVALLLGCAANPAIEESRAMLGQGRLEDGVLRLEQALRDTPDDRELRAFYFRQRDLVVGQLLATAQAQRNTRQSEAAQATYLRVQKLDPNNARVRDGQAELAADRRHEALVREAEVLLTRGDGAGAERLLRTVLAESPAHGDARRLLQKLRDQTAREQVSAQSLTSAYNKPITLEFRDAPMRTVFEVIARSSGINFVFDKDVRADARVTIFVRNTGIDEVVKLILATNQLERKLLNENSMLIYPNTPAKVREYVELVTRSFYLANADVKQAQALIRTVVKTRDIFADERLNLIVIKDTAEAVRLAERLLESLDMAEPEVMLDVEVLEITRSKLLELGLRFPDQIGYGLLQPTTTSTIVNNGITQTNTDLGGTLAPGYVDLSNRGALTAFASNPLLTLNLRSQAGDGNLLANPRIRVKNREKAKIHIGDKLPVFTTTSTANVGVSASVSYLDVGLKLDVEPNVYLDDEVSIKVGLEVSAIVKEVPGPASSLAYQVGTRNASTVLRLKNGETQVLAGLISDEERSSANRLPGLGNIPVVGRLFSSQRDNSNKTEIVLLITPRIVRNLTPPQTASATSSAGSDAAVGAPPMQLRRAEPRTLSLSSTPSAGNQPPVVAPAAPEAPAPAPEPGAAAPSAEEEQGTTRTQPTRPQPPRAQAPATTGTGSTSP